jgi:hypothetical protein
MKTSKGVDRIGSLGALGSPLAGSVAGGSLVAGTVFGLCGTPVLTDGFADLLPREAVLSGVLDGGTQLVGPAEPCGPCGP